MSWRWSTNDTAVKTKEWTNRQTNELKVSEYHAKVIIEILVPRYRENGETQFGDDLVLFSLESHDKSESNYFK